MKTRYKIISAAFVICFILVALYILLNQKNEYIIDDNFETIYGIDLAEYFDDGKHIYKKNCDNDGANHIYLKNDDVVYWSDKIDEDTDELISFLEDENCEIYISENDIVITCDDVNQNDVNQLLGYFVLSGLLKNEEKQYSVVVKDNEDEFIGEVSFAQYGKVKLFKMPVVNINNRYHNNTSVTYYEYVNGLDDAFSDVNLYCNGDVYVIADEEQIKNYEDSNYLMLQMYGMLVQDYGKLYPR